MAKFRKKPVIIEAVQFHYDQKPWPDGVVNTGGGKGQGWVETLEGGHIASDGDWIITGVRGEKYPCKNEIFHLTYEPVLEEGCYGNE
ncbi:MAG: hypothetical protein DRQ40_05370 [Gammaproteobacteria bacterium]|nr:MAG: hypothetical protein DRQ40_05370 [Gammaproteobacteria bacterium]